MLYFTGYFCALSFDDGDFDSHQSSDICEQPTYDSLNETQQGGNKAKKF
jgi:hypothetical protein